MPLEAEEAQKIATDNDDIILSFPPDVDPYSSVFNVSFNPADGTRASVKYLYELGHRDIALLAPESSVSAQLRLKKLDRNPEGLRAGARFGDPRQLGCAERVCRVRCRCCAKRRSFRRTGGQRPDGWAY